MSEDKNRVAPGSGEPSRSVSSASPAGRLTRAATPPGLSRVETGPLQFDEDWPGVFIRGDQALFWAFSIREYLKHGDGPFCLRRSDLKAIADMLDSADASQFAARSASEDTQPSEAEAYHFICYRPFDPHECSQCNQVGYCLHDPADATSKDIHNG